MSEQSKPREHECAGCGGRDGSCLAETELGGDSDGLGMAGGSYVPAPLPQCSVCLGAGRISDRMPARDAVADAETLRLNCESRAPEWAWTRRHVIEAAALGGDSTLAWFSPREAARSALRAVPSLRSGDCARQEAYDHGAVRGSIGLVACFCRDCAPFTARAAFRAVPGLRG